MLGHGPIRIDWSTEATRRQGLYWVDMVRHGRYDMSLISIIRVGIVAVALLHDFYNLPKFAMI